VTSLFQTLRRNLRDFSSNYDFLRQSFHRPIIIHHRHLGTPKIHDLTECVSREVFGKGLCGDIDWIISKSHCRLFTSISFTLLAGTGRKTAGRHSVPVTFLMHQTSVMHSQTPNLYKFLALRASFSHSGTEHIDLLHTHKNCTNYQKEATFMKLTEGPAVDRLKREKARWKEKSKNRFISLDFISSKERSSCWDSREMTGLVWNSTFNTAKPRYRNYQRQWFQ
jgi:hypothetical protein